MRKSSKEIEAAEAMILLSRNKPQGHIKRTDIPYLRYSDRKVYIEDCTYDLNENGNTLRFVYNTVNKVWTLHVHKGCCIINESIINEGEITTVADKSKIMVGTTSFFFNYNLNKPKRQQKSYQKLIIDAIESSENKKLTLSEIYSFFTLKAGFDESESVTWKNSERHNLSLSKIFVKKSRHKDDPPGKGSFWSVNHNFNEDSSFAQTGIFPNHNKIPRPKTDLDAQKGNFGIVNLRNELNTDHAIYRKLEENESESSNYTEYYMIEKQKLGTYENLRYANENCRKRKCTYEKFIKRAKHAFLMQRITIIENEVNAPAQILETSESIADLPFFSADHSNKKRSMSVVELGEEFESLFLDKTDGKKSKRKKF